MTLDITDDANLTSNTTPERTDRLIGVDNGTGTLQDFPIENLFKGLSGITIYTSGSGTYTVPDNVTMIDVIVVGGGGGGGGVTGAA